MAVIVSMILIVVSCIAAVYAFRYECLYFGAYDGYHFFYE